MCICGLIDMIIDAQNHIVQLGSATVAARHGFNSFEEKKVGDLYTGDGGGGRSEAVPQP